ncbi:hypothetical protein LSAT2_019574 [Lamellibrachia satsuma]|nr:hypothetical protein LSAT2_019574 [Lamellibrachia satsuma]
MMKTILLVVCFLLAVVSPIVDAVNAYSNVRGPSPLHRCLHTCYSRYQMCTMPCTMKRTKPELDRCMARCVGCFDVIVMNKVVTSTVNVKQIIVTSAVNVKQIIVTSAAIVKQIIVSSASTVNMVTELN